MDQVVAEYLRKYPPKAYLLRKCTTDYKIPDSDVTIEKDVGVVVPVMGIHHDPEYYPNPEEFDPERFNQANKRSRPQYSYLPFGEGRRNCIGLRFGLILTKVALTVLLKNYKVTVSEKTEEPLEFPPSSLVLEVKGDIWLNIHKI